MKKRFISCVLTLTVSAALCACSSAKTSTESKEDYSKQETEETNEESSKESSTSDAEKANDLPIGYIADDGYYNSYFGFKFVIPEGNLDEADQDMVIDYTVLRNNMGAELSDIDTEDYKSIEDMLTGYIDSNGAACVYSYLDQPITIGDESVIVTISVHKLDGKTIEDILEQDKASIKQDLNYLSHSEAEQTTVELAGESRDCLTYIKDNEQNPDGSDGTMKAVIYCVKDDYVCEIGISEYNSLENVLTAFEAF